MAQKQCQTMHVCGVNVGGTAAHILILEGTVEDTAECELQTSSCSFMAPRGGSMLPYQRLVVYTEHT